MPELQELQQTGDRQYRQRDSPGPDPWPELEDQQAPEQDVEDAAQGVIDPSSGGTGINFGVESQRHQVNEDQAGPAAWSAAPVQAIHRPSGFTVPGGFGGLDSLSPKAGMLAHPQIAQDPALASQAQARFHSMGW